MRIKSEGEKSHNRSRADIVKSIRRKEKRGKRMARRNRKQQMVCRCLLAIGMVLTILIVVIIRVTNKEEIGELVEINNVNVYIGEREIDINSLNFENVESEKVILPEMIWFERTSEMNNGERLSFYMNNGNELIYPQSKCNSVTLEQLSEEEQRRWTEIYSRIEAGEEEKRGNAENVKDYRILSSEEYWENSQLCFQAYIILPQSEMCKQYARNAGDALFCGLAENVNLYQLIKYMDRAYGGYTGLFCYRDSNYTTADNCYWISEIYYQSYYHCSELSEEEREHCVLMAYVFLFYGNEAAENEDNVQHSKELEMNLCEVERELKQYGYQTESSK